jgi:hypothetical protein
MGHLDWNNMDARLYAVALAGLVLCGAGVAAATPSDASQAAVAACEAEVTDTVHQMRPRDAQQFEFIPAKRLLVPSQNDEVGVKGEGRYRRAMGGTVSFTYSCAFNLKTGKTSGAVFNETTHRSAPSAAAWQPDMSKLSPEDCELAVASLLKDKHPKGGNLAFNSGSRQLKAAANGRVLLVGKGSMERASGMRASALAYQCDMDDRTGRVLQAEVSVE